MTPTRYEGRVVSHVGESASKRRAPSTSIGVASEGCDQGSKPGVRGQGASFPSCGVLVCFTGPTVTHRSSHRTWTADYFKSGISHIWFDAQQKTRNQSAASQLRHNQEATAASRCFKPRKETEEEACQTLFFIFTFFPS